MQTPTSDRRRRRSSSNPIAAVDPPTKPATKSTAPAASLGRTIITDYLPRALAFGYGLFLFTAFALRGIVEGGITKRPSKEFWERLQKERDRQWDLATAHPSGLYHEFCTLGNGFKFHYLTNSRGSPPAKTKNLVIFLHGFPDSAGLWSHVIELLPVERSSQADLTVVAPDLPGFSGTDSLRSYGPDEVLTATLNFCQAMRERCLEVTQNGKVILVGFDWGGVVAFRLASEAPQIADRFIIANSALPKAAMRNIQDRFKTGSTMFATWKRQPTNRALLFKAFGPLKPVLAQLQRSGYIFIFNLPWALAQATISRCNLWLLRLMHSLAQGKKSIEDSDEVIAGLAGYLGPRQPERVETEIASTYGQTVIRRSKESAPFTEPLRYYREGLATNPWNQDLETILKLNAIAEYNSIHGKRRVSQGFASGLEGALGVPATILFGMRDVALDTRIMLEGLDEYLTRGSHIVQLPKLGHWSVRQGDGPATIAAVIRWELEEGKGDGLEERIREVSASAKITTSK